MSFNKPQLRHDWLGQFAQDVMDEVQNLTSGSDGIVRNAEPYYLFGNVWFEGTPSDCPSMRWRQGTARWSFDRDTPGGFGISGSLGTMNTEFQLRIVGNDRSEAWGEMLPLLKAIQLQRGRPPIGDIRITEWSDPGDPATNGKEGFVMSFTAPIMVPEPAWQLAQVTQFAVTASLTNAVSSSVGGPGPLTGSVPYVVTTFH